MSKNLFITGTGTDVGKTFVSGLILKKLNENKINAGYFKAAMSGNTETSSGRIPGDAVFVKNISGINQDTQSMCPYVYKAAVSPHLASRLEGNPVKLEVVKASFEKVAAKYDYVVVEGSGGILCPLCFDRQKIQLEDVIKELSLSCVIVANAGLGTINDVALTVFYMKKKYIPVKGIIFNHFHPGNIMEEDNLKMCEYLTGVKVIASISANDNSIKLSADALTSLFE